MTKTTAGGPGIGRLIRARRKSIGMTQSELASSVGVSFQQVQKYERGINGIEAARLQQICDSLRLPPDFFANQSGLLGHETSVGLVQPADLPTDDDLQSFLTSIEGLRLIRSFRAIGDRRLRRHVLDFIAAIAGDEQMP